MGSELEQELDDSWWLGLRATAVHSLDVREFSVVLRFSEGPELTIEAPATIRDLPGQPEAPAVAFNLDGTVAASDALLALVGQEVASGVGFKTGALRLVFQSGAMLRVPPSEQYEAWQLTGSTGRQWVSLPGGGLASFPAP